MKDRKESDICLCHKQGRKASAVPVMSNIAALSIVP